MMPTSKRTPFHRPFDYPPWFTCDHRAGRMIIGTVDQRMLNIRRTSTSLNGMPASIGFRPTQHDRRILREAAQPGESTSDTLRRALRLLDHERWLMQFRADAEALSNEDLGAEPDAW